MHANNWIILYLTIVSLNDECDFDSSAFRPMLFRIFIDVWIYFLKILFQTMQQMPCFRAKSCFSNKSKHSTDVTRYSNLSGLLFHAFAYSIVKWHNKTPERRLNGKCLRKRSKYEIAEFGVFCVVNSSSLAGVKNALAFAPVDAIHLATNSDTMPFPPLKIVIKLMSGIV